MLERDIEKKFCIAAKRRGWLALKFVSPGRIGVPDRILITATGKISFVELKAPRMKPRASQRAFFKELARRKVAVTVLDSLEAIDRYMEEAADVERV